MKRRVKKYNKAGRSNKISIKVKGVRVVRLVQVLK